MATNDHYGEEIPINTNLRLRRYWPWTNVKTLNCMFGETVPRKKDPDMASFQDWLMETRGLSAGSASTYASNVRRLKALQVSNKALQEMIDVRYTTQQAALYRTCWNAYAEWASSNRTARVQVLVAPMRTNTLPTPRELPSWVSSAAWTLLTGSAEGVTADLVAISRWEHVVEEMFEGGWLLTDPRHAYTQYRVPIEPIKMLRSWADPEPSTPLIPSTPRGIYPVPSHVLRRLVRVRK